ncbi:MAG: hypothetical protein RMJ55_13395, partial [Roseiflexaceae bacterium]|nr:hypothetical protein [Roseiflexaceae bacterium]
MSDLASFLISGARLTLGTVFLLAGLIKWLDSKMCVQINASKRLCRLTKEKRNEHSPICEDSAPDPDNCHLAVDDRCRLL